MTGDGRELFVQRAKLWTWITATGATLYFLRFTGEVAEAISALAVMRRLEDGRRRGWGSLRAEAKIGSTQWTTMVVPGDGGTWLLPVKRAVRQAEDMSEGAETEVGVLL